MAEEDPEDLYITPDSIRVKPKVGVHGGVVEVEVSARWMDVDLQSWVITVGEEERKRPATHYGATGAARLAYNIPVFKAEALDRMIRMTILRQCGGGTVLIHQPVGLNP